MTVAEIHSVLWDVSSDALRDATDMRSWVSERNAHLNLVGAQMPEEATTINLARRIAVAFSGGQQDRATVVLHTRGLEGGNNKQGQKSKADLELCIEIAPGTYCDLVLQAKRMNVNKNPDPQYTGWNPSDNAQLIRWAKSSGQTPGMILYSEDHDRYFPGLPDLDTLCNNAKFHNSRGYYPEWRCGNYSKTSHRRFHGSYSSNVNPNPSVLLPGSPAGVVLCLNQPYMTGLTDPSPADVWDKSFPWEHLLHDGNCLGFSSGGTSWPSDPNSPTSNSGPTGGSGNPGSSQRSGNGNTPSNYTGNFVLADAIKLKNRLPNWAVGVLREAGKEIPEELSHVEDNRYFDNEQNWEPPTASIVIQLG